MNILYGIVYVAAYTVFLVGASLAYRNQRSRAALLLMAIAALAANAIGLISVRPLQDLAAQSGLFFSGVCCVIFAIWGMYPTALIFWSKSRLVLFQRAVVTIEFSWFIGTILLTYGYYRVPLV